MAQSRGAGPLHSPYLSGCGPLGVGASAQVQSSSLWFQRKQRSNPTGGDGGPCPCSHDHQSDGGAPPARVQGEDHEPSVVGIPKAAATVTMPTSTSTAICSGLTRYSE